MIKKDFKQLSTNQSGAAEAWWAHNPQVPGSKPGSDRVNVIINIMENYYLQ